MALNASVTLFISHNPICRVRRMRISPIMMPLLDAYIVTEADIPENAPVILPVMCDGIDSGPKRSRYSFYQP